MNTRLLTLEFRSESDVVFVRQRARQIAALLAFDTYEQTRIATAVSEIVRNALLYAGGGRAQFAIEGSVPAQLIITISDSGPGVPNLATVLSGSYKSATGMGQGVLGARKLMDSFHVDTVPGDGTTVALGKTLTLRAPSVTPALFTHIASELGKLASFSPMEEIRQQNAALLRALDELKESSRVLERTAASEQAAHAEAEAAVLAREELLAIVSHDLRNPLSVIVTSASTLQRVTIEGKEGERVMRSSQVILRSAQQMDRLISDLLDLARIHAGKLVVEQLDQDVAELLHEAVEMLSPLTAKKSLRFDGTTSAALRALCDRERVLQILSNLVGNAIKFTPEGGSIFIEAVREGDHALFLVRDTGQGIPEDELPKIFDRFWQAQRKDRTGIGLGLSIVKGLVEALHGRLWVESTRGAGTTFFFTLPLGEEDP